MPKWAKWLCTSIFLLFPGLLFVHFGLEGQLPIPLATLTYELSTSWLIFFLYLGLCFIALSLGRMLHLVPASLLKDSLPGTLTVLGITTCLLIYGSLHYHHKYREPIDIRTEKPLDKPLTIVMVSDLHIGYHNRRPELARWIDLINAEQPDLVLVAGDIIDRSLRPVCEGAYAEEFRRVNAPILACLGNHEYICGAAGSEAFYADAGIRLLKDAAATACGIRIVGRDDRSAGARAPLSVLAPPDSLYTILLDHQPLHLEEAEQAGIDFQFSGHTHHGQVWPGNWVTDLLFEKAFGPHQRGATRYYISSGLGIWGGKFRIGTRSEYIVLTLHN